MISFEARPKEKMLLTNSQNSLSFLTMLIRSSRTIGFLNIITRSRRMINHVRNVVRDKISLPMILFSKDFVKKKPAKYVHSERSIDFIKD